MDRIDRKLDCEIRVQALMAGISGKYQNWISRTHAISCDISNSFNNFDFESYDFSFHQKLNGARRMVTICKSDSSNKDVFSQSVTHQT